MRAVGIMHRAGEHFEDGFGAGLVGSGEQGGDIGTVADCCSDCPYLLDRFAFAVDGFGVSATSGAVEIQGREGR